MPEYLSKEEVRQWRSSLEKITLEEFAARLGKVINEEKETRDIVDIVLEREPRLVDDTYRIKTEKITTIAQKAFARERELTSTKFETKKENLGQTIIKEPKNVKVTVKKEVQASKPASETVKVETPVLNSSVKVTFKKALTEREQMVFDHFLAHKNSIVYAKDLAELLDLPRDYVYKYIKNLRNKINEDALENASNGGYILKA